MPVAALAAASLVERALGDLSTEQVAKEIGTSGQLVRQWTDPQHPASPNVRYLLAGPAAFTRAIAQGLLDHLDARPVVPMSHDDVRAAISDANVRMAMLAQAANAAARSPHFSEATQEQIKGQIAALREDLDRILRAYKAWCEATP